MKNLILILILFTAGLTFGQSQISPFELSNNEKLSTDAYTVFKTNKFLDFKERDTLVEIINNTIYKKTDLNNYFGYKKNWNEIEKENFDTYKQDGEKYDYKYTDSTMIETYKKLGSYNVWREIKTVYTSKGFVLSRQEKVFVGDNYNEIRSIINEFDNKNRVIKITHITEHIKQAETKETIIYATYEDNLVKVTSENGTIVCKFLIK